jgi:hypothetical protein
MLFLLELVRNVGANSELKVCTFFVGAYCDTPLLANHEIRLCTNPLPTWWFEDGQVPEP